MARTYPPPGGVRARWPALPEHVRAAVEGVLGSPVRAAVDQTGGFSPGVAARVRCADGRRAFVKAVGPELNPQSPGMYREEAAVAAALPEAVPVPRLLGSYDDGSWVALVFEEVDGRMPETPWRDAELRRVTAALTELSGMLTPCPVGHVPSLPRRMAGDLAAYGRLAADPPADLDAWEARNLDRLADLAERATGRLDGTTLVHLDVRADNVLLGADGRVYFVDWPWAARGPVWADTVLLMVNAAVYGHDPEAHLDGHPLLAGVDPADVSGLVAGLTGMWSEWSRRPPPPGLPTVRAFQGAHAAAGLAWLRRRTGWS